MRRGRRAAASGVVISRADAYLGVMIDDLVTPGCQRALSDVHVAGGVPAEAAGRQCGPAADAARDRAGLRGQARAAAFEGEGGGAGAGRALLEALALTPNEAARHGLEINRDGRRRSAFELLAYPGVDLARLAAIWPEIGGVAAQDWRCNSRSMRAMRPMSSGKTAMWQALRRDEEARIPADFDIRGFRGCRTRCGRSWRSSGRLRWRRRRRSTA